MDAQRTALVTENTKSKDTPTPGQCDQSDWCIACGTQEMTKGYAEYPLELVTGRHLRFVPRIDMSYPSSRSDLFNNTYEGYMALRTITTFSQNFKYRKISHICLTERTELVHASHSLWCSGWPCKPRKVAVWLLIDDLKDVYHNQCLLDGLAGFMGEVQEGTSLPLLHHVRCTVVCGRNAADARRELKLPTEPSAHATLLIRWFEDNGDQSDPILQFRTYELGNSTVAFSTDSSHAPGTHCRKIQWKDPSKRGVPLQFDNSAALFQRICIDATIGQAGIAGAPFHNAVFHEPTIARHGTFLNQLARESNAFAGMLKHQHDINLSTQWTNTVYEELINSGQTPRLLFSYFVRLTSWNSLSEVIGPDYHRMAPCDRDHCNQTRTHNFQERDAFPGMIFVRPGHAEPARALATNAWMLCKTTVDKDACMHLATLRPSPRNIRSQLSLYGATGSPGTPIGDGHIQVVHLSVNPVGPLLFDDFHGYLIQPCSKETFSQSPEVCIRGNAHGFRLLNELSNAMNDSIGEIRRLEKAISLESPLSIASLFDHHDEDGLIGENVAKRQRHNLPPGEDQMVSSLLGFNINETRITVGEALCRVINTRTTDAAFGNGVEQIVWAMYQFSGPNTSLNEASKHVGSILRRMAEADITEHDLITYRRILDARGQLQSN